MAGRDRRADGDRQERARHRPRPAVRRARSSTATRPRSTAASTSAPTRSRSRTSGASRTTWSTSPIPRRTTPRPSSRRDAAAVIRGISARGRLPILVGGTGLYYRALTRGLFPGPSRDLALRARLERIADRRGVERLHRPALARRSAVGRADPAARPQAPVRALEVYFLTGRPLTAHFAETDSPLAEYDVTTFALQITPAADRRARRGDGSTRSSRAACSTRSAACSRQACPRPPIPLLGLVYRQALEHLHGVRDEAATRELIVRENRSYARRQLIWFRKEPNLQWLQAAGERDTTRDAVGRMVAAMENQSQCRQTRESRPTSAQPNIQDVFLNYARREKLAVHIRLMDGTTRGADQEFRSLRRHRRAQRRRSHDLQARDRRHQVAAADEQLLLLARSRDLPQPDRVIVIVLDSVGIGELPDARAYGDEGSDTLGNIARACRCACPTLRSAGPVAARRRSAGRRPIPPRWAPSAGWPRPPPARTRSPATGR